MKEYKIGIDVGGTNTDAVLLDHSCRIIHCVKTPTTPDVESGIFKALELLMGTVSINRALVKYVMLGTTHATNALVQRKNLAKTSAVRICLPAGQAIEPMFTWDNDLKSAIGNSFYLIHGGSEFDGRPLHTSELDTRECLRVLEEIKKNKIESIAVTSIFSPAVNSYEKAFEHLAKDVLGTDFPITLSSEIGKLGLLERENAAILNASLVKVIEKIAIGLENALNRYEIEALIFFSQNDGTLLSLEMAKRYPVLTIGSGPTNSIRGAAYLSQLTDCIVCDIGGTTTDIGILTNGFPRESSIAVNIGGVRTNFRMPDIISIGIGGGSVVHEKEGCITVGPDSLGYKICTDSIAFGGAVLTVTDCLLALGYTTLDHPDCDPARLHIIDKEVCRQAMEIVYRELENAINKIKTKSTKLPIVLVGGGAILIQGNFMEGSQIIRPEQSGCANAIGAAIANASGEIDIMLSLEGKQREDLLAAAKEQAVQRAVDAGARPSSITIVDFDEVPIAYLTSIIRIKAKAAGEITS